MKRISRPLMIINGLLLLLAGCLFFLNLADQMRERASARLVQEVYRGQEDAALRSLSAGADPNTYFDSASWQALPQTDWPHRWLAQVRGQKPVISPGSAPVISLAITYGHKAAADHLLRRGADVNAPDDKGSTPLQYAALHNERDILITLLDHHADVNHRNKDGNTALHIAAAQRDAVNMQLLLDHGADPNLANGENQTPLDVVGYLAEDLHREWIVKYGESRFGDKKPGSAKNLPQKLTQHYRHQLELLRPLITVLEKNGAKPSAETQNRLAGSYDLNPREIEQALASPAPAEKGRKATH